MNRQTATVITAISAVVALCLSLTCCGFGFASLAGGGTYQFGSQGGQVPPMAGIPAICLGILVWALPAGLWFFLVRQKQQQ